MVYVVTGKWITVVIDVKILFKIYPKRYIYKEEKLYYYMKKQSVNFVVYMPEDFFPEFETFIKLIAKDPAVMAEVKRKKTSLASIAMRGLIIKYNEFHLKRLKTEFDAEEAQSQLQPQPQPQPQLEIQPEQPEEELE